MSAADSEQSIRSRVRIALPELSLIVLIGPSGAGKTTFARKHFKPTEIISSDVCRGLVSDNEVDQSVSNEAFEVLHLIAAKRLALGKLTVIDATNVQPESRRPLVELAREHYCLPVAIVFNIPEKTCCARNDGRPDRDLAPHAIRRQIGQMRRGLRGLAREGFRHVFVLEPEEVDAAVVERVPLWNNRKDDHGPFDIIGDVHGCCDEMIELLTKLGYVSAAFESGETAPVATSDAWGTEVYRHPDGRKAIFVGDLVDRGPHILDSVRLVRNMVAAGSALCVPGNHDMKLLRKLRGKNVRVTHGLELTLAEIEALSAEQRELFCRELAEFLDSLISHYVLDGGRLVVAHAGLKEAMHGRASGKVREFALYGDTTGETDEFGLPVRQNWAADYRGRAAVVYGHTPVPDAQWLNNTINIGGIL